MIKGASTISPARQKQLFFKIGNVRKIRDKVAKAFPSIAEPIQPEALKIQATDREPRKKKIKQPTERKGQHKKIKPHRTDIPLSTPSRSVVYKSKRS